MRAEASQNPHDAGVQTRLRALLDLQRIVQSTSLPQDQLELIKTQVTELAAVTLRATSVQNSSPASAPPSLQQQHMPPQAAPSSVASAAAPAPAAQAPVTLDALLGPGALATLMARQSSQNSTPNPPAAAAIRSPPPAQPAPYAAPPAQAQQSSSLLDQLRQAGLLPSATPTNATPVAPPPPMIPPNIASLLAPQKTANGWAGLQVPSRRGLDTASLQQP